MRRKYSISGNTNASYFIFGGIVLIIILVWFFVWGASRVSIAQVSPCGGTPNLGGARMPDLNSDGCVDDADLSILLSCWGYTTATAPVGCLSVAVVSPPPQ